jgi:hypothetical protein
MHWQAPILMIDAHADRGPVLVTVENRIALGDVRPFSLPLGTWSSVERPVALLDRVGVWLISGHGSRSHSELTCKPSLRCALQLIRRSHRCQLTTQVFDALVQALFLWRIQLLASPFSVNLAGASHP